MTDTIPFTPGGYAFVKGVFQYSAGVAALPGFTIERVRFADPVPLARGFERVEALLKAAGRPTTSFCACELHSPAPFSEAGFKSFNTAYVGVLQRWGLISADGTNPVARSNTCPEIAPPAGPSFHAFCYTRPARDARPSFVVAGSGEAPEGKANYRDHVIRPGDTSPAGLREKAHWVLGEMERRLAALGCAWPDTTAVQLYTVFDIHAFLGEAIVRRGAARHGLTWHFNRPPVAGLDYEMDCRGVDSERVVAGA
jgi:hypothetical protein